MSGWYLLLAALAAYALYVFGVRARRRHVRWAHDMDDRGLCQWPTKLCYSHADFFCWGCRKRLCINHVHDDLFDDLLWCDWCYMSVDAIKYVPVHLNKEGREDE